MHSYAHCSTIYNNQNMKATQVPKNRWQIKKLYYIYTMEYYSALRKDSVIQFADPWKDLESNILSKLSQRERGTDREWTHSEAGDREI